MALNLTVEMARPHLDSQYIHEFIGPLVKLFDLDDAIERHPKKRSGLRFEVMLQPMTFVVQIANRSDELHERRCLESLSLGIVRKTPQLLFLHHELIIEADETPKRVPDESQANIVIGRPHFGSTHKTILPFVIEQAVVRHCPSTLPKSARLRLDESPLSQPRRHGCLCELPDSASNSAWPSCMCL